MGSSDERTRILAAFFHNYRWGWQIRGDERGFLEKAKILKKNGWDVFVLEKSPSMQDDMGQFLYHSLKLNSVRIPPNSATSLIKLIILAVFKVVMKTPRRFRAIYAYNQDIENTLVGYILKIFTGAPLVIIYHQLEEQFVEPFRVAFYKSRKRGFNIFRSIERALLPALNRYSLTHADVHISLSEATKVDLVRILSITNCFVVRNGLDTKKFSPVVLPKVYDACFLGRLDPQKGIDTLLKGWAEVVRTKRDATLILIGGGPPRRINEYQDLSRELGLGRNVTFAGFQTDPNIVKIMNSSRLFVFPSKMEGFAQAVSQAMGCGLCCILSDIPALRENYGDVAVLVPAGDYLALGSSILKLLNDEGRRKILEMKARAHVLKYSWETSVAQETRLF